ncbi:MAG: SUMF1/EgtB/PvdO family nonheme iron enzyme [Chloroflexi bacterium]|nr:SUMF1/EgtB/PvdO family nonheme iron enzyme [Chloroflexota bacterium]
MAINILLQLEVILQGASWVGALDMAGNVWEWTNSPYDSDSFVLRGGSWYDNQRNVRASDRIWDNRDNRYYNVGFRLVSPIFLSPDSDSE